MSFLKSEFISYLEKAENARKAAQRDQKTQFLKMHEVSLTGAYNTRKLYFKTPARLYHFQIEADCPFKKNSHNLTA